MKQASVEKAARILECNAEINECHASTNKNQEEYDKQLLTLSSGLLALSLAFIKDVVPMPQAAHKGLLYSSFVFLTLCVFATLASYQISNLGLAKAKKHWESKRDTDHPTGFPYGLAVFIRIWNVITGMLFTFGIVLTVSFVVTNLHQETALPHNSTELKEGAQIRVPASGDLAQKGANLKAPPKPPPPPPSTKK